MANSLPFETSPSQFINYGWAVLAVGCLYINPIISIVFLFFLLIGLLNVACWKYRFYEDRVSERKGIFNVNEESVNYFRIKSIKVEEPFWMRIFGLSIIHLTTSEQYKPHMRFYGVDNGKDYVEFLQKKAKLKRKEYGIRDMDIFYS